MWWLQTFHLFWVNIFTTSLDQNYTQIASHILPSWWLSWHIDTCCHGTRAHWQYCHHISPTTVQTMRTMILHGHKSFTLPENLSSHEKANGLQKWMFGCWTITKVLQSRLLTSVWTLQKSQLSLTTHLLFWRVQITHLHLWLLWSMGNHMCKKCICPLGSSVLNSPTGWTIFANHILSQTLRRAPQQQVAKGSQPIKWMLARHRM